jgi:glucose-6-phosphate 1-dehydrogenase
LGTSRQIAVDNLLAFRFANTFAEAFWNRNYIESVEITMAENFGVLGRGLYDQTGTIRDVVQNHLFQVLSNLAMEPPVGLDSESVRDEKVKVLKAIPAVDDKNLVRGQFLGYRDENGVSNNSRTGTFAALKLEVNSWRWKGVPFYIRAGKAASSPIVLIRLMYARSASAWRNLSRSSSARFLSVTSIRKPTNSPVSPDAL